MRLLLLTILVCPLFAITNVGGDITENTVWGPTGNPPDSIYNLIGPVRVLSPATLTIQPGTRVQSVGYEIEVYGSLIACGTPTEKVEFTSASPTPNPGSGDGA